jgi:two-component system, chemotaxis family, chemotaxis protein CheY
MVAPYLLHRISPTSKDGGEGGFLMEGQAGIRTLIVEASVPTRRLLRKRLEVMGCTIVGETGNQKVGLEIFRQLHPLIVTLDVTIPQVDGFTTEELFKIIRAEKPSVGIILISAGARSLTAMKYISQGAIEYQEKPFVNFDRIREKLDYLYPHMMARRGSRAPASQSMLRNQPI